MITPLRSAGAGGDQENVMFLSPGVTVKLCGGPVGPGKEQGLKRYYSLTSPTTEFIIAIPMQRLSSKTKDFTSNRKSNRL